MYLILDRKVASYDRLFDIAKESVKYGVDIVQLRSKYGTAEEILAFSKKILALLKGKIPYVVNDRIDLAMTCGADGVHVGQDDLPLTLARRLMRPKAIIGVSCQNLEDALRAQKEGATYIGFGSIFKTLTKPGRKPMDLKYFKKVLDKIKIPVFAIGGINKDNVPILKAVGARHFAVSRSICLANSIKDATLKLKEIIEI